MPLWKVYHPVGAYSAQDKKEFAEKVTAMYSRKAMPCNNPPCMAVDQGRREIAGAALPPVDQAQVSDVTTSIKNATQP